MLGTPLRGAIERVAPLRGVVKSPAGQHVIQTARGSRAVCESARFAARQCGPSRTSCYRVRGTGTRVLLRHRTRDVHIFNEIFGGTGGRGYDPPPVVRALLDAGVAPRVLDLGANIGLFGAYVFSQWPRATVRSLEPDPANARLLRATIAANGLHGRWSVAEVAAANADGEVDFCSGLFADSHLTTTGANGAGAGPGARTITIPAVDLFAQDHDVDLMKMDIEGGEWAILTDARLGSLSARALVLEWHASGCPQPDPRAAAIGLLRDAGYTEVAEAERGGENGLVWAWRRAAPPGPAAPGHSRLPPARSRTAVEVHP